MIYELRANLFFETQDPIDDIWDKILDHWSEAKVINPCLPNQQCSEANLILCHHDDHPPEACTLNEHMDNCPECP